MGQEAPARDTLRIDLWEDYLEASAAKTKARAIDDRKRKATMSGNHMVPTRAAARVKALETILEEKGLVDAAALDSLVDTFETKVGPRNGARVVAKAWTDPAFRKRLLDDATKAVAELGYGGPEGGHLVAVENTPSPQSRSMHIVLMLSVAGPGTSAGMVQELRLSLARGARSARCVEGIWRRDSRDKVEVRVWDSSAEQRYLVIPQRPAGTEKMSEEQLANLSRATL